MNVADSEMSFFGRENLRNSAFQRGRTSFYLFIQKELLCSRCSQFFCHVVNAPKGPGKRGHIVLDTLLPPQMFPRLHARARNICCGHKYCVRETKDVSDFIQKHFGSATNVFQFAQPKKHHGQQCVLVYQVLNISQNI